MQLIQSFILLFTLCYTSMAAWYGNSTGGTNAKSNSVITLSPTYSIQPVTTVITYADPTTTFFITQTVFSTVYYTPLSTSVDITSVKSSSQPQSLTTMTTTSASTLTTEFASTYSDASTTYTLTITSTLKVYKTILRTTKNQLNTEASNVGFTTSANAATTTNNAFVTATSAVTDADTVDAATTTENAVLSNTFRQQCMDITNTVTVTETANPITVTVTPNVQYVTRTVTVGMINQSNGFNSTLSTN